MNNIMSTVFATTQCPSEINVFGIYHLSFFTLSFVFTYLMIKYKWQNDLIEKIATLVTLGLHIFLYIWYHFSPEHLILKGLPLYTCRLVLYLYLIGIFFKKQGCLKLASYWGFYGGIAGLIFPTIFKYPFPHILQISTFILHVYIFTLSGNYLFVKKIGMTKADTFNCCKWTVLLLTFNTIFNMIFDTNYTSTFKMPAHLITLGIDVPAAFCYLAVTSGYIFITFIQHFYVSYYEKITSESEAINYDSN